MTQTHPARRPRRAAALALATCLSVSALAPATAATDEGERRFTPTGTAVEGADRATSGDAPTLTAGSWTDTISVGDEGIRYYSVERTIPGSRLRVSTFSDPGPAEGNPTEGLAVSLLAADDASSCSSTQDTNRSTRRTAHLVTATALSSVASYDREKCVEVDRLVLRVERRSGGPVPAAVEINVVEEPPLASDGGIPAGLSTTPEDPSPLTPGTDSPVRGGSTFHDAPLLENGTYVDDLVPGEVAYYRADVDWGQHATFALVGPVDDTYVGSGSERLEIVPRLYRPDLRNVSSDARASGSDGSHRYALDSLPVQHLMSVPEVRYNNRAEGWTIAPFSLAGSYYYALSVPTDYQGTAEGRPVPVRFAVEVGGEVRGEPDYTEAFSLTSGGTSGTEDEGADGSATTDEAATTDEPTSSGSGASTTTDDSPPYLLIAGAALAVLLGAGGGLLVTSRRNRV